MLSRFYCDGHWKLYDNEMLDTLDEIKHIIDGFPDQIS